MAQTLTYIKATLPGLNLNFPKISWRAYHVWQRNLSAYKKRWLSGVIGNLGEPIIYLFAFGLGLGYYITKIDGLSYIQFIGPGLVASSVMFAATFECTFGSYTRMSEQRIFESMIATPLSIEDVIGGEILWGTTKGVFAGGTVLLLLCFLGLVKSALAIFLLPVIILEGMLFASLALTFTSLAKSYDCFSYYFTIFMTPMVFLSGIFFPLDGLPAWARTASFFLPLTHVVNMVRPLALGNLSLKMFLDLLLVALVLILFLILSLKMMRRRLIK